MGSPQKREWKNQNYDIQDYVGYLYAQEVFEGVNAGFVYDLGIPVGINGIAVEDCNRQLIKYEVSRLSQL